MTQVELKSGTNRQTGLTGEEVSARISRKQHNKVTVNSGLTEGQIILRHCFTYFNLVFVLLAVMLAISGSSVKNMTFMVVVLINTVLGIVQQIRAKRAVDKLSLVAAQKVQTLRDGKWEQIRSDLLVQDDIVEYRAGDQICADGVVLDGVLYANESLLTGEADAVEKTAGDAVLSGTVPDDEFHEHPAGIHAGGRAAGRRGRIPHLLRLRDAQC